jgi:hypothetical protein
VTGSQEMFFADADPDAESPDLGLWAELLDEEDVAELGRLSRERRENPGGGL